MHITIRELMGAAPAVVPATATLRHTIRLLLSESTQEVYVVDASGRFLGSVPDYELLKAQLSRSLDGRPVTALMSESAARVDSQTPVSELAALFRDGRHRRLPVVEEERLVGQVDRRDVMRLLAATEERGDGSDASVSSGAGRTELLSMRNRRPAVLARENPKSAAPLH